MIDAPAHAALPAPPALVSHFWSGDTLRSRTIGDRVVTQTLDIPVPPDRVVTDWQRETTVQRMLELGEVETLPFARTRARWPAYPACVAALQQWMATLGLTDAFAAAEVALLACRGATYHHDAAQYGGLAFCNLFLSDDCGLDLLFPHTHQRIPLTRGTAVIFDTGQAHGVVPRGQTRFDPADFATDHDYTQIFLSWELPIEHPSMARALNITFDPAPGDISPPAEEQVLLHGEAAGVCPDTGRWQTTA